MYNKIDIKNITYNDTDEIRLSASENFNWYLQKKTGVSCTWGKNIKETPEYDPIGPQQIIWKIINFNLYEFIKKFNFLANIHKKVDNNILAIQSQNQDILKEKNLYICMSTLSNIIFIIDDFKNINLKDFKIFCQYIRFFNININIQYNLNNYQNLQIYNQIYNLSCKLILNINSKIFDGIKLYQLIEKLKDKFTISVKLHINENSNIQISKFIDKIDKNISCILYNESPYLTVRKYLNLQSKILSKELTNFCLSQCAKTHYSKKIIGSIILQLPCSACRYTLYLEDFNIYDCQINKNIVGNLNDFKTLDILWNTEKIFKLRQKLISKNKC